MSRPSSTHVRSSVARMTVNGWVIPSTMEIFSTESRRSSEAAYSAPCAKEAVASRSNAAFEAGTDYVGSPIQQTMLTLRVRDLDAMLPQLRDVGADVASETQELEGVGRFGWVTDPEGTRVELWQPA